ncbi:hypothetical protein GC194_04000 [bacterium]|nr:hypothetical protein [bacterium]
MRSAKEEGLDYWMKFKKDRTFICNPGTGKTESGKKWEVTPDDNPRSAFFWLRYELGDKTIQQRAEFSDNFDTLKIYTPMLTRFVKKRP